MQLPSPGIRKQPSCKPPIATSLPVPQGTCTFTPSTRLPCPNFLLPDLTEKLTSRLTTMVTTYSWASASHTEAQSRSLGAKVPYKAPTINAPFPPPSSPRQGGQAHPCPLSHTEWVCNVPTPQFVPGLAAMTGSDSRCHCPPPATTWGPPKSSILRGLFGGQQRGAGIVSTHIYSEVLEALELAEVFLQFAVNIQIFGFGIF